MKSILSMVLMCCMVLAYGQQPVVGRLIRIQNFPSVYVQPRHIDVWLPKNYSPKKKYTVVYMHDGQMLFDSTKTWNKQEWGVDEVCTQLMNEKKIKDVMVVGVWNNGNHRYREYFPQKALDYLSPAQRDTVLNQVSESNKFTIEGVQSDNYLKFLVHELKPYIDKNYSTHRTAKHTIIAGSSMGGLISWYALCEYPEVFGKAACISTHWPGIMPEQGTVVANTFFIYLRNKLPQAGSHTLYFDTGTVGLDSYYPPLQKEVDTILKEKGYTNNDSLSIVDEGADHSEKSWQKRLHIPFEFLLKN